MKKLFLLSIGIFLFSLLFLNIVLAVDESSDLEDLFVKTDFYEYEDYNLYLLEKPIIGSEDMPYYGIFNSKKVKYNNGEDIEVFELNSDNYNILENRLYCFTNRFANDKRCYLYNNNVLNPEISSDVEIVQSNEDEINERKEYYDYDGFFNIVNIRSLKYNSADDFITDFDEEYYMINNSFVYEVRFYLVALEDESIDPSELYERVSLLNPQDKWDDIHSILNDVNTFEINPKHIIDVISKKILNIFTKCKSEDNKLNCYIDEGLTKKNIKKIINSINDIKDSYDITTG